MAVGEMDLYILDESGQVLINWDSIALKSSAEFVDFVKKQLSSLDIKPVDFWSKFYQIGNSSKSGYVFFREESGLILQCQFVGNVFNHAILIPDYLRKLDEMGWF